MTKILSTSVNKLESNEFTTLFNLELEIDGIRRFGTLTVSTSDFKNENLDPHLIGHTMRFYWSSRV